MALFTISDLHLPLGVHKPMDVFGPTWENYVNRLRDNWQQLVKPDDIVVLPGDFSWATYIEQSKLDFEYLHQLNGKKILLKGNHDYWWTTMNKLKEFLSKESFDDVSFMHNNAFFYNDVALCGTRGWVLPQGADATAEDEKIYAREVQRLELSLKEAKNASEIIVFLHYPPLSQNNINTQMTQLMKRYPVKQCIYGHLHAISHKNAVEGIVDGIDYKLVSCDYTNFTPILVLK